MRDGLQLGTKSDSTKLTLDPKALTTHGFVLGMTGSGKTGLCVVLLEELLASGVPVIAVDSKGDLGTLLLGFDPGDLTALAKWAPDAVTASQQLSAAMTAAGFTREQLAAFRESYEPRLYTPGSSTGLPVDVLGSLAPPSSTAPEVIAEAADGVTRALLGLLGIEADPVSSREYLLLVQLLTHAWRAGQTPSLVDLVRQVATPPFTTVGALGLDDFFPAKDRQGLMVRLNGLLASPKFAAWRQGEPLDPAVLLRAPDGRPRLSVYSVAHLSDEERVVAVAQLLERVQGWMRKQGGAPTVRAVLLIDEIYGYFPPSPANPPTKPPLIALLKQARAFGLSVVLATQNPIDLDYRGLANIGTWLVGRLQTEQDKARIRDALVAAAASTGVTGAELDGLISTLAPRHFLIHSVHQPKPAVFKSRDAVTLLHGPFSAEELQALTAPMKASATAATPAAGGGASAPTPAAAAEQGPPVGVDPELGPVFEVDQGVAQPFLLLKFGTRYRVGTIASEETVHELAFPIDGTVGPADALEGAPSNVAGVKFVAQPPQGMQFTAVPGWATAMKAAKVVSAVKERLPSKLETKLWVDQETKLISGPTESLEAFTARVMAKLSVSKGAQALMTKLERKRADLAQAEREVTQKKAEKWLSVGAGVLGLFGGRRGSSLSGVGRAMSSHGRQGSAEAKLEDLALEVQQLEQQVAGLKELDPARFQEVVAVPRPADVQLIRAAVALIVP